MLELAAPSIVFTPCRNIPGKTRTKTLFGLLRTRHVRFSLVPNFPRKILSLDVCLELLPVFTSFFGIEISPENYVQKVLLNYSLFSLPFGAETIPEILPCVAKATLYLHLPLVLKQFPQNSSRRRCLEQTSIFAPRKNCPKEGNIIPTPNFLLPFW